MPTMKEHVEKRELEDLKEELARAEKTKTAWKATAILFICLFAITLAIKMI